MPLKNPLRDYGLGDSTPYVRGLPKVTGVVQEPCPNCGCEAIYSIEVSVDHPRLWGGVGVGRYTGCAACPWASPMLMAATTPKT